MPCYIIYFNREWVGDRSAAWIRERAPLAQAVVDEMRAAGVYVVAGGLETENTFHVEPGGNGVLVRQGRHAQGSQSLGGLTVIRVDDEPAARTWAGRLAEACGWPQEVSRFMAEVGEGGEDTGPSPHPA